MLELHIAETTITDSNVKVGWCVDAETLKDLAELGIKDPQLVLMTSGNGKEYRKVVPLRDLTAFLEFRAAGPNKIWGFIDVNNPASPKDTRNFWLSRYAGTTEYIRRFLNYEGDNWGSENPMWQAVPLSVDVPDGAFASPPSAWEQAWCSWIIKAQPIDQCEFRRLRLFAYGVQPFLFLANYLLRLLCTLMALLMGFRGFSLEPLLHPLSTDFSDVSALSEGGSFFFQPKRGTVLAFLLFLCMPLIALPLLIGVGTLIHFHLFLQVVGVIVSLLVLVIPGYLGVGWISGWMVKRSIAKDELPAWYLAQEEMNLIVCSGRKKPFDFNELPKSHRTIRLRFEEIKSRVCRPFSA